MYIMYKCISLQMIAKPMFRPGRQVTQQWALQRTLGRIVLQHEGFLLYVSNVCSLVTSTRQTLF